MPLYKYECNDCSFGFEEIRTIANRKNAKCPKCKSNDIIQVLCAHQVLTKNKWKQTGKGKIDGGIPFGSVPGDNDYKDINNPLGPKP